MVIWLGLSRAGRLFPRPCAAGDLTYAGGTGCAGLCPDFLHRKNIPEASFRNALPAQKTPNLKVGRILLVASVIRLGFEPKTHSLEGCCSIQLSYRTRSHSDGLARLVVLF